MSSEKEKEERKWWPCEVCGKQFPTQEGLAGHAKVHNKDRSDYITREDFEQLVNALKMGLQGTAHYVPPVPASAGSAAVTPSTPPVGSKIGQFIVRRRPNMDAEDIVCPNCGFTEIARPLPVVEKEKPVKEEVEVIPPGYIEQPHGGEDWLRVLNLKHPDGKGVDDCPECAKALMTWFNQHKSKLERASRVAR